jgi:hypothetical protein
MDLNVNEKTTINGFWTIMFYDFKFNPGISYLQPVKNFKYLADMKTLYRNLQKP